MYELIRAPGFARLPLIVEDFVKDSGAGFSGEFKLVPLHLDGRGYLLCVHRSLMGGSGSGPGLCVPKACAFCLSQ